MKFERNFITQMSKQRVIEITTAYFVSQGFTLTAEQANDLQFNRGSQFSNFYTFNPLNIQSKTRIQFTTVPTGINVIAIFDINTIGQTITHSDEAIWQSFVNNYERSILAGHDLSQETQRTLQQGKKNNLKYMGWAILGAVVAGVPAGFIAYWTGIDSIASTGAVVGALGLMFYKINQDKEKNGV